MTLDEDGLPHNMIASYQDIYDKLWDNCIAAWNPDTRCEAYLADCIEGGGLMAEAAREVREDLLYAFPLTYEI